MNPKRTVTVLRADEKPLEPCHPARARELLRKGRARLVSEDPFVITLLPPERPKAP